MHGNIFETFCFSCRAYSDADTTTEEVQKCGVCKSGLLRPGVVWFGEALPVNAMQQISIELQKADLILVVGTSGQVYPAAGFASVVQSKGGKSIEINIEQPVNVDLGLTGKAGELLPQIVEEYMKL